MHRDSLESVVDLPTTEVEWATVKVIEAIGAGVTSWKLEMVRIFQRWEKLDHFWDSKVMSPGAFCSPFYFLVWLVD